MNQRLSRLAKGLSALFLSTLFVAQAEARDDKLMFSIQDVLTEYEHRLNEDVNFYFGDQSYPEVVQEYGEFPTNKKTNAFGKSDLEACKWVMLSALLALEERAVREGGNAVVNIRSYYDRVEVSSETEYECHAGTFVAGVALIGQVVTVDE